jgi:hypothetical protein
MRKDCRYRSALLATLSLLVAVRVATSSPRMNLRDFLILTSFSFLVLTVVQLDITTSFHAHLPADQALTQPSAPHLERPHLN